MSQSLLQGDALRPENDSSIHVKPQAAQLLTVCKCWLCMLLTMDKLLLLQGLQHGRSDLKLSHPSKMAAHSARLLKPVRACCAVA